MKFALYLPNFGNETSARSLAELAKTAEDAGWDGFFIWDHMLFSKNQKIPIVDPWVALAAVAMNTSRIRFGTTVTPIARRRPWKLARETVTLDHLSNGRLILAVGLGEPADADFAYFGEQSDRQTRAEKLDEGLAILAGLWRGKPFSFQGKHYKLEKVTFLPPTYQTPRIPVWVGGFWPNPRPFKRAARWDGVIPLGRGGKMEPDEVREAVAFIHQQRKDASPFDVAIIQNYAVRGKGKYTGIEKVLQFEQAGATWWLEALYLERNSMAEMRAKVLLGPPR